MSRHLEFSPGKQQGITLVAAMVMLIALMVLGISAMTASNVMTRLAGNLQFENEAKNRAENALIAGEKLLLAGTNSQSAAFSKPSMATSSLPFYDPTTALDPLNTWPSVSASSASGAEQYVIQLISPDKICPPGENCMNMGGQQVTPATQYYLFRVTAKGTSVRGASRLVESIVQVPAP